jgi:tetratricopeptide (TPR) repeat protein
MNPQADLHRSAEIERDRFAEVVGRYEVNIKFSEAVSHHQAGRFNDAREGYLAVLTVDAHNPAALNNLALLSPPDAAERHLRQAVAVESRYVDALLNLAYLLLAKGLAGEAQSFLLQALHAASDDCRVVTGLAQAYESPQEFESAMQLLEDKGGGFSKKDDLYCRLAKCCEDLNKTDDALAYAEKALQLNPEHTEAHIYKGRQLLKKGDYVRGAEEIAWIWHGRIPESQIGLFVDASGQPIRQDGRTVVLSADSGLGDTLQFVRYAKPLKALGARIVVECQPELVRLIGRMSEVDRVCPIGNLDNNFDIRLPLHNLIGSFRSTPDNIPGAVPYLTSDPDEAREFLERLQAFPGPRVGLCWSGNPGHPQDAKRSIFPALIAKLIEQLPAVSFLSLQKQASDKLERLVDWSAEFTDLARTAALVENLDLVITVDTCMVHLAGALARPVWLLNRFDSCWRWMEDRNDSPWYPTLTLFRQRQAGQWEEVIGRVSAELSKLVQ